MTNKHIAVDMDEVLCETVEVMLKYYNYELAGQNRNITKFTSWKEFSL